MLRYLPVGLPQYVLNNYTTKSPPRHLAKGSVSTPLEWIKFEKITADQFVRGRGGTIAVIFVTHWKGFMRPSRERGMDLQHSRRHIPPYTRQVGVRSTSSESSVPPHAHWFDGTRNFTLQKVGVYFLLTAGSLHAMAGFVEDLTFSWK